MKNRRKTKSKQEEIQLSWQKKKKEKQLKWFRTEGDKKRRKDRNKKKTTETG
jgi:hypothetical protein